MGRTVLLAGLIALVTVPLGQASTYVPGHARQDGLYVPPHFRAASGDRHAAEAWFDALSRSESQVRSGKLPGPATTQGQAGPALDEPRI